MIDIRVKDREKVAVEEKIMPAEKKREVKSNLRYCEDSRFKLIKKVWDINKQLERGLISKEIYNNYFSERIEGKTRLEWLAFCEEYVERKKRLDTGGKEEINGVKENIRFCKESKEEIIKKIHELNKNYENRAVSKEEYYNFLNRKINGRNKIEWLDFCNRYIEEKGEAVNQYKKEVRERIYYNVGPLLPIAAIVVLLFTFASFVPLSPTGFVVIGIGFDYSDNISLMVNESYNYTWAVGNYGSLKSVRLDGSFVPRSLSKAQTLSKAGYAKAYLEYGDKSYLIFDSARLSSKGLEGITGLAVSEIKGADNDGGLIPIRLDGGGGKDIKDVFEFKVVSEFGWNVSYKKLCTLWEINNIKICYGSDECCGLIGFESLGKWNDTFYLSYGRYGSGLENTVKAQVIYANYSLDIEHPYSDVVYSDIKEAGANFYEAGIEFKGECIETCLLPNLNTTLYRLRFIVENATLQIGSIKYSIEKEVEVSENAPALVSEIEDIIIYKNGVSAINLSDYFSDKDNNELVHSAYDVENISIAIKGSIATLRPEYNFTGKRHIYFTAYDGYYNASSNLVVVNVIEKPLSIAEVNVSEEAIKPRVVINKPVRWVKSVNVSAPVVNLSVNISSDALNVTVRDVKEGKAISEDKIRVNDNGVIKNATAYRVEKRIEQIDKIEEKLQNKKQEIIRKDPTALQEVGSINKELLVLQNEVNSITGYAVASDGKKGILTRLFEWLFGAEITGYAVYEGGEEIINESNTTAVIIEDIVEDVLVEYYTEAPVSEEVNISASTKQIVISSDVHYEDILAYTYLGDAAQGAVKLYWVVNGTKQIVDNVSYYDLNNNSLVDYIEWVVPSLSNQTYELVIEISSAQHLDSNRNFIEDIYDFVKAQDNNWNLIPMNDYVRVTFKENLTNKNDITVYARANESSRVEVYSENGSEIITTFENILNENYYKVYLTNLLGIEDTFDLKMLGDVEIDYIVDPTTYTLTADDTEDQNGSDCPTNPTYAYNENWGDYSQGQTSNGNCNEYENYTWSSDFSNAGGVVLETRIGGPSVAVGYYNYSCYNYSSSSFAVISKITFPGAVANYNITLPADCISSNNNLQLNVLVARTGGQLGSTIWLYENQIWYNASLTTNDAPNNPSPTINSTDGSNVTTQNLNCYATISDPEANKMNVSIQWHKNSITNLTVDYNNSYANGTFFNAVLGSGNLSVGQNWSCGMGLYDGQNYSSWANSSNLTILNSAPTTPTISYPQDGKNYSSITSINFTSTDADGDAISYKIYINNTLNITTTTNITQWNASDGYYNLTVTANDGTASSANSSVVKFRLDATPPSWSNNATNASLMQINGNATFNITISDQGSGLSFYIFSWNGTGVWNNNTNGTISGNSIALSINKSTNLTSGNTIGYIWYANDSVNNWNNSGLRTFTVANTPPTGPTVVLNSTLGTNYSSENLTVYANSTDADNEEITYIYNWYKNNKSLTVLNLPFNHNNSCGVNCTKDYSPYNNSGRLGNITDIGTSSTRPSWNSSGGIIGGAYQFDGYADYISVNDSNSLDINNSFSIEVWIKPAAPHNKSEGTRWIAGKWQDTDDERSYGLWAYSPANGYSQIHFAISSDGSWQSGNRIFYPASGDFVSIGDWKHIVGIYNHSGMFLYVDGSLVQSNTTFISRSIYISNINVTIGQYDYNYYFNGTIDEVRIYNYSLSAEQIYQNYIEGLNSLNTSTIVSSMTAKGDVWKVSVTPNDGFDDGVMVNSSELTILNTAPTAPNITYPENGKNYSDIPYINYSSSDADGDSINYTIYVNGTLNITTAVNVTDWNASDGYYNLTVSAFDGADSSSNSTPVLFRLDTIAPSWSNNRTNASLMGRYGNATFNITISDYGSGLSYYIFSWNGTGIWDNRSNGSISGNSVNLIVNKSTNLSKNNVVGYIWYANDSAGNWNNSELRTFTVANTPPTTPIVYYPVDGKNYSSIPYINYSSTDADNDTITYKIYVNRTLNASTTVNLTFWNASDGYYNLTVSAWDGTDSSSNSTPIYFRMDTINPVINLISPNNNSGDNDGNVTFSYNVSEANTVTNCSLIINNLINTTNRTITKDATINFTLNNMTVGSYNWSINCSDSSNNINSSETRRLSVILTTNFGGNTTDLSLVNVSNITHFIIERPGYGKINYSENVDLSEGADLDTYVNISFNHIEVNITALPALNKAARLYFYNLTYTNPRPVKYGVVCPSSICAEVSYDSATKTFIYDVTHFTVYSAEETPVTAATEEAVAAGKTGGACTPTWDCTEWSECSPDGKQTRACSRVGSCLLGEKPEEERDCIYIAPKPEETCDDGIQNGDEEGIDCGGVCKPCKAEVAIEKKAPKSNRLFVGFMVILGLILFYSVTILFITSKTKAKVAEEVRFAKESDFVTYSILIVMVLLLAVNILFVRPAPVGFAVDKIGVENSSMNATVQESILAGYAIVDAKQEETCFDNIKNQNEAGIDCGGPCKPCSIEIQKGGVSLKPFIIGWLIILSAIIIESIAKRKNDNRI